jgi:hypothetical protein
MAFRVGQKVARIGGHTISPDAPPIDVVCTVSWVGRSIYDEEAINLVEFPANTQCFYEPYYRARFFRPITEKKTDISVFTRILDKVNGRETVKCP